MALCLESGYTSLNKKNEELCGDNVESTVAGGYTTLVLADGMGSGVKANILSTLTSKILCTMVAENIDIEECVETIVQSLPACKVRGVAYSTFSVIHMNEEGKGYLFEFDNPHGFIISRISDSDSFAIFSFFFATAKSLGLTSFTRLSVHCAESITAVRNV